MASLEETSFKGDSEHLYVFPLPPSLDTSCPICFSALYEDPYVNIQCGHHFCGSCTMKLRQCPKCRCTLQAVPDKGLQRVLKSILVYCSRKEEGCQWKGDLDELHRHQTNDCMYISITCSSCSSQVLRCQMGKHQKEDCLFRPATCEHCDLQCNWVELNEVHYDECPLYPLTCSICNATIPRGDMGRHQGMLCPKARIACEASEYGCTWEGLREELEEHLKDNLIKHLHMCTRHCLLKVDTAEEKIEICMEEISKAGSDLSRYKKDASNKVDDIVNKCKKELSEKVKSAQERIDRCKAEVKEMKEEMVGWAHGTIFKCNKEIEELRDEIDGRDDEIASLHLLVQESIKKCKKEIKQLKGEIDGKDAKIISLHASAQEATSKCYTAIKELEDKISEKDYAIMSLSMSVEQEMKQLKAEAKQKNAEIASLRQRLSNLEVTMFDHMTSKLSALKKDMEEEMNTKLKEMEARMREEFTSLRMQEAAAASPSSYTAVNSSKEISNKEDFYDEECYDGDEEEEEEDEEDDSEFGACAVKEKPTFTYNLKLPTSPDLIKDMYLSQEFYAGFYKMCLRVHPTGYGIGKGLYLSVYVCLVKGKYDDVVEWPFYGEVKVYLQHNASGKPLGRRITYDSNTPQVFSMVDRNRHISRGNGCPKFLFLADLDKYLMSNNKLVFEVHVKIDLR